MNIVDHGSDKQEPETLFLTVFRVEAMVLRYESSKRQLKGQRQG